jgi:hypothetical protein
MTVVTLCGADACVRLPAAAGVPAPARFWRHDGDQEAWQEDGPAREGRKDTCAAGH